MPSAHDVPSYVGWTLDAIHAEIARTRQCILTYPDWHAGPGVLSMLYHELDRRTLPGEAKP